MTTETSPSVFTEQIEADVNLPEILTTADTEWLKPLAGSNRPINEDSLAAYKRIAEVGAKHLTDDIDPETLNSMMRARRVFFEDILGWGDEGHRLHRAYGAFEAANERLMPLDTVVATLRTYHELGLDSAKVINTLPAALSLNSDSVRAKVAVLDELGLDSAKVINTLPAALSLNSDSVRAKVAVLEQYGYYDKNTGWQASDSTTSYILMLPNETLLLFLSSHEHLGSIDDLPTKIVAFRGSNKNLRTASGRKDLYRDCYPELTELVGCLAVRQGRRNKTDLSSYLEGETIPAEVLRKKPESHADIIAQRLATGALSLLAGS